MTFAIQQPKHGDTIMHCGHLAGSLHWFQYETPIRFQRPDGTRGEALWFAACEACFCKHGVKATRFVRGDGIWTGDAPAIEERLKT
jgi:hypothetical protein